MKVFKICVAQSNLIKYKSYSEIPENVLFVKFVKFIRKELGCNFLSKKIERWYNENNGKTEKEFSFRFRGKESLAYLKHFANLIHQVSINIFNDNAKYRLYQVFYQSIQLRKVVSFSVRIEDFNDEILNEMNQVCKRLYKSCCVFDQKVTPSMWTLCNAAPYHSMVTFKEYGFGLGCNTMEGMVTFKEYGFGLGCNTMEGREQKHQQIQKYAENTTFQCCWPLIFRHEFIQLIHLRENGFDVVRYRKRGTEYLPRLENDSCVTCASNIFMQGNKCEICDSVLMAKLYSEIKKF